MKKDFINGFNSDYKEVDFLVSFIDKDVKEPDDDFDKLIYKVNLILSKPSESNYIQKLIELVLENNGNIKQISRIVFVLLNNQDIMNKEELRGNSFGETILKDLLETTEIDNDSKRIILDEFNYVYNSSLTFPSIIQEEILTNPIRHMIEVKGGKNVKKRK